MEEGLEEEQDTQRLLSIERFTSLAEVAARIIVRCLIFGKLTKLIVL
jgi:hypothetical protein